MVKSAVFQGESLIGEVEIHPQNSYTGPWIREIRIADFSPPSDRCPPLAVLLTIAAGGVRFKMESTSHDSPLFLMHAACLREQKTAIIPLGEEEIHLVAMPSRRNLMQQSCFWGFSVAPGLYTSCLVMLNLRCLGIVFDLDETLIVANTMRSFEDRIDALQRKVNNEMDPQRVTGILAEIKRYQDDKSILKQYVENDQVIDNGKVYLVQPEIVPPLSDSHQLITRPVIRLQEKNIILTRVNPAIRDTSVLVRLRPAWEDLRGYLTARGRKRFEVYVCTMAERDYAFEMWRLLDPESNLIHSRELLDRIVCVKSGSRKSLLNVFQDGICHPRMALVIDDRLKVWDEKDQPRVHVVPAFAPYYAPQAEANSMIPVLCVARNVACNVRGGFFKEFDEGMLPQISNISYEDETMDFPSAPDVSNYLISEEDMTTLNGSKDPLCFEGITDTEVQRRLKDPNYSAQAVPPMFNSLDPRIISSLQHVMTSSGAVPLPTTQILMPLPGSQCLQSIAAGKPLVQSILSEPSLQGSPAREEGEVPESELDPDTRRRLLILQHGQDTRELPPPPPPPPPPPQFPVRPPLQVSGPPVQPRGSWFPFDEELSPKHRGRAQKDFSMQPDSMRFSKKRSRLPSFNRNGPTGDNPAPSDRVLYENQRLPLQVHRNDDRLRSNGPISNYNSYQGEEMPIGRTPNHRDVQLESGPVIMQYPETSAGVLQEIAIKCGAKVEFRTTLCDTTELQFSIEVWFFGERIGEGIGRTRKEAQDQAAETSLRTLADKFLSNGLLDPASVHGDLNKFPYSKEKGFLNDSNSFGNPAFARDEPPPVASTSEDSRFLDHKLEESKKLTPSVAALKELCTMEGFTLGFQCPPSVSANTADSKGEIHAQVEVAGQILGKGMGTTWEEAKLQAAEEALGALKSMLGQFTQKRSDSPRSLHSVSNKRLKAEFSRVVRQISPSNRYSKHDTPVH
ncbi:hypothetical protein J5N97_021823 [Dioscorea zingiberensis]|uniref:protein-serine/threonine phosphatase n=1 Tax=Dioscorea zingiberensis TaxID=325984 RepID=A0A9D5C991_9LILI|nr:hypothetical protein J5N97_021823 [Dioscorea zingiberensis]